MIWFFFLSLVTYILLVIVVLKKVSRICFSILLLCFSFYYTKIVVDIVRENNPIMKTIRKEKENYTTAAVNAEITDDTIVPGISGQSVEVSKSFQRMVDYGAYHDSLYTFEEVKPAVSIDDYYDKYVLSGRSDSMKVSLVFTVDRDDDLMDILTILSEHRASATFFIDGLFLENHRSFVKNMLEENYEVEILSYNGNYEEVYFKNAVGILNDMRGKRGSFCFSRYKNSQVLDLCKKLEFHTVVPSIIATTHPFQNIKSNMKGGSILLMGKTTDELEVSIRYIEQRGYSLVRLDELLSE